MADEKDKQEIKEEVDEKDKQEMAPVQMVIELLQTQNRMIGALTQTISKQLQMISADVETSKVLLGKLVKFGPPEIKIDQKQTGSQAPDFGGYAERTSGFTDKL